MGWEIDFTSWQEELKELRPFLQSPTDEKPLEVLGQSSDEL